MVSSCRVSTGGGDTVGFLAGPSSSYGKRGGGGRRWRPFGQMERWEERREEREGRRERRERNGKNVPQ